MRASLVVMGLFLSTSPAQAWRHLQDPPPDHDAKVYFSGDFPDGRTNFMAYKVPDSYYGVSRAGGGPAVLGVLFGPIGAAANALSARSASKDRAQASLFGTDVPAVFKTLGYPTVPPDEADPPHYELTPAVGYLFSNDTAFTVYCNLRATLVTNGRRSWTSRYVLQDETTYDTGDAQLGDKLKAKITDCYTRTTALFDMHRAEGNAMFSRQPVRLYGKPIPYPVVTKLLPDRVVQQDEVGLYEFDKAHWTLDPAWQRDDGPDAGDAKLPPKS